MLPYPPPMPFLSAFGPIDWLHPGGQPSLCANPFPEKSGVHASRVIGGDRFGSRLREWSSITAPSNSSSRGFTANGGRDTEGLHTANSSRRRRGVCSKC